MLQKLKSWLCKLLGCPGSEAPGVQPKGGGGGPVEPKK